MQTGSRDEGTEGWRSEMRDQLITSPPVVDIKQRDILGMRSPSPTTGPPAQGTSARKIRPPYFWLQKPVGIELMEETSGVPSSSS